MPRTGAELAEQIAEAAITRSREGFAQLSSQYIERVVDCYSDHLGIDLPDAGQGKCCPGALVLGPQACTCWTAVYDLGQQPIQPGIPVVPVPVRMCGDCAYRPGSPEKQGDSSHRGGQELLDRLVATGEPFYCHRGIRRKVSHRHPSGTEIDGHPGDYDPPIADGVPYKASGEPGDLCAGCAAAPHKGGPAMTNVSRETVTRETYFSRVTVPPQLFVVSRETVTRETPSTDDGRYTDCGRCGCLIPKGGQRYCRECGTDYQREWAAKHRISSTERKLLLALGDRLHDQLTGPELAIFGRLTDKET